MDVLPTTAPFGSWASPITSDLIVADSIGLIDVLVDGNDIYWLEQRPREMIDGVEGHRASRVDEAETRWHDGGRQRLSIQCPHPGPRIWRRCCRDPQWRHLRQQFRRPTALSAGDRQGTRGPDSAAAGGQPDADLAMPTACWTWPANFGSVSRRSSRPDQASDQYHRRCGPGRRRSWHGAG